MSPLTGMKLINFVLLYLLLFLLDFTHIQLPLVVLRYVFSSFRWVEHIHAPHEYLVRQAFPGIRLDQFGDVEELFNVNLWVYELVEEERVARPKHRRQAEDHANEFLDLEAGEVDGESDDETSSELSDEAAVEVDEQHLKRRQKSQTALLFRKPPKESQEKQDRLNIYLNRYGLPQISILSFI